LPWSAPSLNRRLAQASGARRAPEGHSRSFGPMAAREEIIGFCDELLDVVSFEDYGPIGLQVPGAPEVATVATGVSANRAFIEGAIEAEAQLAIAHHGLFWRNEPQALSEQMAERLRTLLEARVSLAGYHLPLDAHPEIGNNALLCAGLGFERTGSFSVHGGRPIGSIGRSDEGLSADELKERVAELVGREPLTFDDGPAAIKSIGIVSGGASKAIRDAIDLGLDAYLTGEPSEPVMADAREGGIHFFAAGHYATETFGVRRLGELIAERFGVAHRFIDVPNPI
jgi:dinuclear metal center YbgI/SA1388 family protein